MIKQSQLVMIWLLPVIVIGGLFYVYLGFLAALMMIFLITLSFFKGRYWCWNLCPRGAFLDIVLSKVSLNNPVPKFFTNLIFRWLIFTVFIVFLIFRLFYAGKNLSALGGVFVAMCLLTTVIAVVLGYATKCRSWCIICPMGTLQEHAKIRKLNTGPFKKMK